MGKPESYVEDYLCAKAAKNDMFVTKYTAAGTAGVPDRVLIKNGYTVFVETKRKNGVPRKLQSVIMDDMRRHGGYVFAIDTREGVDALVKKILDGTLKQNDSF